MPNKYRLLLWISMLLAIMIPAAAQKSNIKEAKMPADTIWFNFENDDPSSQSGSMQGWVVISGKLGSLICDRDMCRNTPDVKLIKEGRYFLSTIELSDGTYDDGMRGTVISPVFKLTGPKISFLIGGGGHANTYVSLCTEDGTEVFKASGSNSEIMRRVSWVADEYIGKNVFVAVVDENSGPWGHVTFDDFHAEGRIDLKATEQVRANYRKIEENRLSREAAIAKVKHTAMEKHKAQLASDEYLFSKGRTKVYRDEYLDAISLPVGGIGAGCIQINGKAERSAWQIFNNFANVSLPNSFFAVRISKEGEDPVIRALQTKSVASFPAMSKLSFKGEYPYGWYTFEDKSIPVKISMETFSPFIPMDVKDSSIPCAIYNLRAENPNPYPVRVSFLAAQQNAVGYTGDVEIDGSGYHGYGKNKNTVRIEKKSTVMHMTANQPADSKGYGDMSLLVLADGVSADADWRDIDQLSSQFTEHGRLDGGSESAFSTKGLTVNGALEVGFVLQPGESRTIPFILTWYFPNGRHGNGPWGGDGNKYSNWWTSSLDVADYVKDNYSRLSGNTKLYHDTFYATDLPHWLLDRITSQTAILRSKTCFWTADGYFGGWEGCATTNGSCEGNCTHVWHYAQAHARLFPEIGRTMREQDFMFQTAEGGIRHRHNVIFTPAFDGQCGTVLNAYREHLMSKDSSWLNKNWSNIKRATDYLISTWDADEDGVLAGSQWNTLDESLGGSSSWLGSLYLAALSAAGKMSDLQSDSESAARYRRVRDQGMRNQDSTLFNGEYYFQIPESTPYRDYNNGCHIDQVLGQWWANQLGLGQIYPEDRIRKALESLFKYNFHTDFISKEQLPRKFVDDYDAALQMITWPKGGRPAPEHQMLYADEVMTGFEYSAAAAMIKSGLV
ncbi:MAG: GH116 family glycosyl-hydrolase [Armatimonadota bacterium]